MRSTKRLPARSERTIAEQPRRDEVIADTAARARWRCEAQAFVPHIDCVDRLDTDETVPRGRRPGGHLDLGNTQLLCRCCHDFKTREIRRAEILGLYGAGYQDELCGDAPHGLLVEALWEFTDWKGHWSARRQQHLTVERGLTAIVEWRHMIAERAGLDVATWRIVKGTVTVGGSITETVTPSA